MARKPKKTSSDLDLKALGFVGTTDKNSVSYTTRLGKTSKRVAMYLPQETLDRLDAISTNRSKAVDLAVKFYLAYNPIHNWEKRDKIGK